MMIVSGRAFFGSYLAKSFGYILECAAIRSGPRPRPRGQVYAAPRLFDHGMRAFISSREKLFRVVWLLFVFFLFRVYYFTKSSFIRAARVMRKLKLKEDTNFERRLHEAIANHSCCRV